jgi:hypothetical protein
MRGSSGPPDGVRFFVVPPQNDTTKAHCLLHPHIVLSAAGAKDLNTFVKGSSREF